MDDFCGAGGQRCGHAAANSPHRAIGSGYILTAIPAATSIPFCILALLEGGPSTLAALVIVSGLFQIVISMRLSLLRRIFTPTVSGTIMMLLVVTVVSVIFSMMDDVPPGAPSIAGPVCAFFTFAIMVGILLRGSAVWRLWAPVIAIVAGCCAAEAFGIYDLDALTQAPWFGFPIGKWSGPGLNFGLAFWALLPAFLLSSIISVIQTNAVSLSAQRVSWRSERAIDFRRVERGAIGCGLGDVLAGLAGGMPIATGTRGAMLVQQTGCASRDVGILIGGIFLALAFFPKLEGVLVAIPGPIVAMYLVTMMAPIFVEGMRTVIQDEPDYRKNLLVGVVMAIGLGFHFNLVSLPVSGLWGPMLHNALTAGGITIVILTLFMNLTGQGRRRINTELSVEALPKINEFLDDFSASQSWDAEMTDRLHAVAEETLPVLVNDDEGGSTSGRRRLLVLAVSDGPTAELEFASAPGDTENLEDRIALLRKPAPEMPELAVERDIPLRLLSHYASSVSHQQYHVTEIITVRVVPAASGWMVVALSRPTSGAGVGSVVVIGPLVVDNGLHTGTRPVRTLRSK